MLPSNERLRRASVFQRAYNKRMVVSSSFVTLYILPKEGKNRTGKLEWKPLVGFVVSTKVSKSSCKRNLAKRRIREAYRLLRQRKPAGINLSDWYALVFVAKDAALTADYQQIEEAVIGCLARATQKYGPRVREGGSVSSKHNLLVNTREKLPGDIDNTKGQDPGNRNK